jgi:hypothetical protein
MMEPVQTIHRTNARTRVPHAGGLWDRILACQ